MDVSPAIPSSHSPPQSLAIDSIRILQNPSLRHWRDRKSAALTLGYSQLSPQDRDAAASTLMEVLDRRPDESLAWRILRTTIRCGIAGSLLMAGITFLDGAGLPPGWVIVPVTSILSLMISPVVAPLSLLYDRNLNDHVRAAAALALGQLNAPESVGVLSAAFFDRNREVREAAAIALHGVLPALGAEHFGYFTSDTITKLGRAVSTTDGALIYKLLEALKHIGTSHAMPYVEKVAHRARTVMLRKKAGEVLRTLEERKKLEIHSDKLLRAADPPEDSSELLLRPARDIGTVDSMQLLRPSEKSPGE